MEDARVTVKLNTALWQDSKGLECKPEAAMGYKVTREITHPEMCVVMDEVGRNTSQKDDWYIGGNLLVCRKVMVPQQRLNHKDKHGTLLGLTAHSRDPIMRIIFFRW